MPGHSRSHTCSTDSPRGDETKPLCRASERQSSRCAQRPGQPELLEAGLTPQPGPRWPQGAGRPAARTRMALGSTGEGPVRDGSPRLCPRLRPWQPASPPSQQVEETPEHGPAASPCGCTGPGGRAQKLPPSPPPRPAPTVGLLCRTACADCIPPGIPRATQREELPQNLTEPCRAEGGLGTDSVAVRQHRLGPRGERGVSGGPGPPQASPDEGEFSPGRF